MSPKRYPTPADMEACLLHPAQILETKAGPLEYARRGQGPPLLAVHGGPGGCDQGLGLGEFFRVNGFQIIAPSRPGYLGTPLDTGRTPEEQADALAALLDALNLETVPVLAASAGGPSSYLLAARHPERVSCLLEIDAVCLQYQPDVSPLEEKLYLSKAGLWLMGFLMEHFPESMVKSFLKSESTLDRHELAVRARDILQDDRKFAFLRFLMATMSDRMAERQAGVHNDLAQMAAITQLDLAPISCPTLILHGTADKDVPPRHAEYARSAIAPSELHWIDGGDHVGFWTAPAAEHTQDYALAWLQARMPA